MRNSSHPRVAGVSVSTLLDRHSIPDCIITLMPALVTTKPKPKPADPCNSTRGRRVAGDGAVIHAWLMSGAIQSTAVQIKGVWPFCAFCGFLLIVILPDSGWTGYLQHWKHKE